jgi:hypothetical protein
MAVNSATNGGSVREWLPLTGPDARSAMVKVHDARFEKPVGLKADDAKIRRAARRAFTELQLAFQETGTAISKADAEELAGQFSVLANARAGSKALKGLSNHLQMALLSKHRDKDRVYTVEACLRFIGHCDIDRLLWDLQSLPQRSVDIDRPSASAD